MRFRKSILIASTLSCLGFSAVSGERDDQQPSSASHPDFFVPAALEFLSLNCENCPPPPDVPPVTGWNSVGINVETESDLLNIEVPAVTEEIWQAALYKRGFRMIKGRDYAILLDAKAVGPRQFHLRIGYQPDGASGNWDTIAGRTYEIDPKWRNVRFVFTSEVTTDNAQVSLQLGNSDINLSLDRIMIWEITE